MEKLEVILNGLFYVKAEGELSVVAAALLAVILMLIWVSLGGRSGGA